MKQVLLLTLGCLLLWTTAAVALDHRESSHGVGKKGEITLTEPTKVGDRVLQPDTYVVQHRLLGGEHFLRFVELDPDAEVKCRVEPSASPITETKVYMVRENGLDRITKITIKGEDVVHIF
jgi:hypothetical protein